MNLDDICTHAYNILISTQDDSGEFGKNCLEIIHSENNLRHPVQTVDKLDCTKKPNCSVTLISALGISCYKGINNSSVVKACQWFTKSNYISNGWFQQHIHVVDANPFGQSTPQISELTDIRHTATALLAALFFDAPVTFISDALRNLLADECRDYNNKGWRANLGIHHAPTDFYTTTYMLASLYYLKISSSYEKYGLKKTYLNQLLNNGLNAICSDSPQELGYNASIEQTLRTNGTLLFFLAPLISEVYPDYLEDSVRFIINNAQKNENTFFWINGDYDVTVNVLAGLIVAEKYVDDTKINIKQVINGAKSFIEKEFSFLSSFHPVSLAFILFIYGNNFTCYSLQNSSVRSAVIDNRNGETCTSDELIPIDVLVMVSTEEEEKAITDHEHFEEHELNNGITYLRCNEKGLSIALARGFEYGELDAAIMAQTLYMQLNPKIVTMAGFCAGQRGKQTLGDVVIAEKVFNYDQGKQIAKDKIQPQISSYKLDTRIKQRIERYNSNWRDSVKIGIPKDFELQCFELLSAISNHSGRVTIDELYDVFKYPNWSEIIGLFLTECYIKSQNNFESISLTSKGIKHLNELLLLFPRGYIPTKPSTTLGVLATGTKVQQWDGIFNYLNSQFDRKCNVLDMEGHSMGKIAEFNRCSFIIAKGVGDYAQNGKKFDNRFINYAVYSSYRFLVEFLKDNLSKLH